MKKAELFIGRFQPFHLVHYEIINGMNNPVIGLVRGAGTSRNKDKNPFDAEYQLKMIKSLFTDINVKICKEGYIPDIVKELFEQDFDVCKIYAGKDQIYKYIRQCESSINSIEFVETPRIVSATQIRKLIKSDDIDTFKKFMPKKLWNEYNVMRKILI